MQSIALALLLAGIVMITIGYTRIQLKCPPPRIEYRIVPRSVLDEQLHGSVENVPSMFDKADPFFRAVQDEEEAESGVASATM